MKKSMRKYSAEKEKRWDKELEKDIAEGKLDNLADEALNEFDAGKSSEL